MCYPVKCEKCGKTTWRGCGKHKDMVMAKVLKKKDGNAQEKVILNQFLKHKILHQMMEIMVKSLILNLKKNLLIYF